MVDIEEKDKFINGESQILDTLRKLPIIKQFFERFKNDGFRQIKAIYEYSFKEQDEDILKSINLSEEIVGKNIKQDCLKRCALKKY